ncbi:MAG: serine hydrolase domain-containing protein [Pseudomonadota bacterium]
MIGNVDPRFNAVKEALASSVAQGDDHGAQVAVFIAGEAVVDLADGFQDTAKTLPMTTSTLASVFSSGKAVCAALILDRVSAGDLRYDDKVSSLWPEFVGGGKEDLTVAEVLSHQSGLSGFAAEQEPTIWIDWDKTTSAIAAMEPLFPPGSASGYGPQTFGYIAGEILRRTTGKGVAQHLRRITRDVVCGLTLSEATRVTPMIKPKRSPDLGPITPIKRAAFLEKWSSPSGMSRQQWSSAEIPASNMHASARGLAEVMQLFATGRMGAQLSAADTAREECWSERISGDDLVLPFNLSWGAGLMRENGGVFGAPATAIGHYGFGGSCVLADPARELSLAYVPNQQSPHLLADPRAVRLVEAVYAALG